MIIEFTVGNFLSFKDKKTLNIEATSITEYKERVFRVGNYKLLPSAAIYGANSSGKSNLLKAMSIMRKIVTTSAEKSSVSKNNITPFLLNTETENKASSFEVVFLIDNHTYRYGFEIDNTTVHSEWLFRQEKEREKVLFIRQGDGIDISDDFKEGDGLEIKTRDNALFLSVVDQFNGQIAGLIMKWFNDWTTVSGVNHEEYEAFTSALLKDNEQSAKLNNFYRTLDLGFETIYIKETKFTPNILFVSWVTEHKKYDVSGNATGIREFDLRKQESSGTNKLVDLSGVIFDKINNGGVLVIDELDAKLHPLITLAISNLFNTPEINTKNAQLIFATHDTNLLSRGKFRRDQIFFVEKDNYGATDLYSLIDYKEDGTSIRKDRSFEKDYIQGRYGAIPFIGNFEKL